MVLCEQFRLECLMCRDGKCISLNSTDFAKPCPFYKDTRDMSIREIEAFDRGWRDGFYKPRDEAEGAISAGRVRKAARW